MTEKLDAETIVIGAGAVGLAIAAQLAKAGHEVIVLEAENSFGTQTSSRNSEVIHAGLYYQTGSLKAQLCVKGRQQLYAHLDQFNIAVKPCGKFVIAVDDHEAERMDGLIEQARINDVEGVRLIPPSEALFMEPALNPSMKGALVSDTSGIFDSHGYMLSLVGILEEHGGQIAYGTRVLGGEVTSDGIELQTSGDVDALICARLVVNAAGHGAIPVAKAIAGPHQDSLPKNRFVKGSYFTVTGKTPFSRLIYPMHTEASLGLHLTIDLQGQGKLGPDAEWLPEDAALPFDYVVDPARAEKFYASVRRYWPGLPDGVLSPGYSGVRPKIVGPGEPSGDFRIEGPAHHGTPGLVNLLGIESPGLTSSLAIGEYVANLISQTT